MINIAELLKDCPIGMELDCTMFDDCVKVIFDGVSSEPIGIKIVAINGTNRFSHTLTKYGRWTPIKYTKCVIFPKGKTTWEGFVPPCKFKEGDVISNSLGTCIFKGEGEIEGTVNYYCGLSYGAFRVKDEKSNPNGHYGNIVEYRLATEKEKDTLFKAIEENGYRWYPETKTLEKLIKPKFKVGNKVRGKYSNHIYTISRITPIGYETTTGYSFTFDCENCYELISNKFDIKTLKPFDKVLVRTVKFTPVWTIAFYDGYQPNIGGSFRPFGVAGGEYFQQCIPYEGNEHLRGTTNECEEYYKTWD